MTRTNELRTGEQAIEAPAADAAGLVFIGEIRTPWTDRADCPRQGSWDGPLCRIELFELWREALRGAEAYGQLEVLYWLHLSRRDLVLQSPRNDGAVKGTFALRSPARPNPIGGAIVKVESIEGGVLLVRGLDCLDHTPLLDLKPDRAIFTPSAHGAGDSTAL